MSTDVATVESEETLDLTIPTVQFSSIEELISDADQSRITNNALRKQIIDHIAPMIKTSVIEGQAPREREVALQLINAADGLMKSIEQSHQSVGRMIKDRAEAGKNDRVSEIVNEYLKRLDINRVRFAPTTQEELSTAEDELSRRIKQEAIEVADTECTFNEDDRAKTL